jgi:hypothetical protein
MESTAANLTAGEQPNAVIRRRMRQILRRYDEDAAEAPPSPAGCVRFGESRITARLPSV